MIERDPSHCRLLLLVMFMFMLLYHVHIQEIFHSSRFVSILLFPRAKKARLERRVEKSKTCGEKSGEEKKTSVGDSAPLRK